VSEHFRDGPQVDRGAGEVRGFVAVGREGDDAEGDEAMVDEGQGRVLRSSAIRSAACRPDRALPGLA
jgi:hypothetical protein